MKKGEKKEIIFKGGSMEKISALLRSPYFIAVVFVAIYNFFTFFNNWSFSVKMLSAFNHYWWIFLFGFSLFISLIRKFILRSKPKTCNILLIFFVSYLVVFQSRLVFRATFYFVLTFLFIVSLFTCVFLDAVIKLARKMIEILRLCFLKRPFMQSIIYLILLGMFVFMLRQNVSELTRKYYERYWMEIILLFPVIVIFLKKVLINKKENYFKGVLVYFFAYVFYNLICRLIKTGIAKPIAITGIIFISTRVYFYFDEVKKAVSQQVIKLLSRGKEQVVPGGLLSKLKYFTVGVSTRIKEKSINLVQVVLSRIKIHKREIITFFVFITALIVAVKIVPKVIEHFKITVVEFSPQGQVPQKSIIRATFSDQVSTTVEDINKIACFNIVPSLEGDYRIEGKRTIVFIPKEPLKPSTIYKVKLDSKNLKSVRKKVTTGNKIEFYTELFKVSNVRMFYIYDLATNVEKKIMGEVNFNYPVELEKLREKVEVVCESKPIDVEFEKSYLPTRFYFKTVLVQRDKKEKTVKFIVKKDLECVGGTVPLREDFAETIGLPAKVKFQISDIKLWHEPGNTMITVLFNMPISKEQVERYV